MLTHLIRPTISPGNIYCRFCLHILPLNIPHSCVYLANIHQCDRFLSRIYGECVVTYSNYFYKSIRDNEKAKKRQFVIDVVVLLVAVGQMAQTIYIPAIADMARDLNGP